MAYEIDICSSEEEWQQLAGEVRDSVHEWLESNGPRLIEEWLCNNTNKTSNGNIYVKKAQPQLRKESSFYHKREALKKTQK